MVIVGCDYVGFKVLVLVGSVKGSVAFNNCCFVQTDGFLLLIVEVAILKFGGIVYGLIRSGGVVGQ